MYDCPRFINLIMGNHPNNIENEIAYFYAIVKRMDKDDSIKMSKVKEQEVSIKEVVYNNFSDANEGDRQLFQGSLLGWIELIENEKLYNSVKDLKIEDQVLISHVVNEWL